MLTLGIDLASQSSRTAAATIEWGPRRAKLIGLGPDLARRKGEKCRDQRTTLVAALCEKASWLELGKRAREQCIETDDCLDAVVAALVTRAHALELCEPIPADHLVDARVEG